jgi:hypothetical protein
MPIMDVDPEQLAEQIRQATEDALREAARIQRATQEPEQQREWIRQNNLIYGGLIGIALIMVQPFLTAPPPDPSATMCVIAFSAAIPLLAALLLVNREEDFRRRVTPSRVVRVTQSLALLLSFVGVVAGFWHMLHLAGVVILVCGFVALMVHSAGYLGLQRSADAPARRAEPPAPDDAEG